MGLKFGGRLLPEEMGARRVVHTRGPDTPRSPSPLAATTAEAVRNQSDQMETCKACESVQNRHLFCILF